MTNVELLSVLLSVAGLMVSVFALAWTIISIHSPHTGRDSLTSRWFSTRRLPPLPVYIVRYPPAAVKSAPGGLFLFSQT